MPPSKEQFEARVLSDPDVRDNIIVQQALSLWYNNVISLDVAMLLAVRCLAKQNKALLKDLVDAEAHRPVIIHLQEP